MDTPGGTLGFWASIKHHPSQPDWLLSLVPRMECLHWSDVMQFYHLSQDVQSPWCARDLFKSEVAPWLELCIVLLVQQWRCCCSCSH